VKIAPGIHRIGTDIIINSVSEPDGQTQSVA
jgi:hypothetical protein